jgi:hypothetical protein
LSDAFGLRCFKKLKLDVTDSSFNLSIAKLFSINLFFFVALKIHWNPRFFFAICISCGTSSALRSLIKLNATITSRLQAGTAWLTAKRYKVFHDMNQVSLHKNNKINLPIL